MNPSTAAPFTGSVRYAATAALVLLLVGGVGALLHLRGSSADVPVDAPPPRETGLAPEAVLRGCPPPQAEEAEEEAEEEADDFDLASCEFVREQDLPADPIETGPCALELSFVDANTGEATATSFDLWRLDAPGNADWERGDQNQAGIDKAAKTALLEGLPEGRYRLHVHGAPKDAEDAADPAAFEITDLLTRRKIAFEAPTVSSVRVLVFDERGHALTKARERVGGFGTHSSQPSNPDWIHRRRLTGNRVQSGSSFWMCHGDGFGRGPPKAVLADASGFDLGTWRAASRYESTSASHTLLFEERSGVDVFLTTRELPQRPLVALTLPLDWIRSRTRLGDGTWLQDTDLAIEAACDAVESQANADPWTIASALPIEVRAKRGKDTVASGVMHLTDREIVLDARPDE